MIGIQCNMVNLTALSNLEKCIWNLRRSTYYKGMAAEGAQTNSVQVKSKTYNDLNNNLEDCM